MPKKPSVFDELNLDAQAEAARRESAFPEGIPMTFRGEEYQFPAELPGGVLDAFLDIDFDMSAIIARAVAIMQAADDEEDEDEKKARSVAVDVVMSALTANPNLPIDFVKAVRAALAAVFGEEQWARFLAARPSVPDYGRVVRGLYRAYGVSLGEAFRSPEPSEGDGATLKPTSSGSTDSTPAVSGRSRKPKDSSASAA